MWNGYSFLRTSSLKESNSVSLSKLCLLTFTTERNMQIGTRRIITYTRLSINRKQNCFYYRTFLLNVKCGLAMFKRCSIWYWFVYYIPKPPDKDIFKGKCETCRLSLPSRRSTFYGNSGKLPHRLACPEKKRWGCF